MAVQMPAAVKGTPITKGGKGEQTEGRPGLFLPQDRSLKAVTFLPLAHSKQGRWMKGTLCLLCLCLPAEK